MTAIAMMPPTTALVAETPTYKSGVSQHLPFYVELTSASAFGDVNCERADALVLGNECVLRLGPDVVSSAARGITLNLTAADYVILLDPWWNPAVEAQAADRAHRLGQRLPVTVYRLICQNTIEEKVVNLHAEKMALSEDILADGASSLSAEAMLNILST